MADPILEVADLEVRYGPVQAVRRLSLTLQPAEAVGLIGPNGAGKSTTLLAIMGAIRPHAGQIRLAGQSIMGSTSEQIARMGVALVPEGRRIFGEFTVAENLRLGVFGRASMDGLKDDLEWVHSLFPVTADFRDRSAGQLSGGQQQQLAIARALVARPRVLLLDEPSLGLAPTVVDDLFVALEDIKRRGVAILLIEQRAQLAVEFADRSLVMRNGEVALELARGVVLDEDAMTKAYFGS